MERKTVKKGRRKYDADFKREVIKMIDSGRSVSDISQSLGLGTNLVYSWIKRAKNRSSPLIASSQATLDEEKASLQKRVKELELERDILKKALGIFSR